MFVGGGGGGGGSVDIVHKPHSCLVKRKMPKRDRTRTCLLILTPGPTTHSLYQFRVGKETDAFKSQIKAVAAFEIQIKAVAAFEIQIKAVATFESQVKAVAVFESRAKAVDTF